MLYFESETVLILGKPLIVQLFACWEILHIYLSSADFFNSPEPLTQGELL